MFFAGAALDSSPSAVGARAPAVSQGKRKPRDEITTRRTTKDFQKAACEAKDIASEQLMAVQAPDRRALWRQLRAMSANTHCGGMYHSHIADQLSSADPFSM